MKRTSRLIGTAVIAVVIAVVIVALIALQFVAARNSAIKTAVKESDLPKDGNYIICDWTEVTGFSWYVDSSAGMGMKGT